MANELQGRAADQVTCRVCPTCSRQGAQESPEVRMFIPLLCYHLNHKSGADLASELASAAQMLAIMQANGGCLQ